MANKIAIIDYKIVPHNPIGGCHRQMIASLCREHEFTVFAVEFDNPCPERVRWVRIPVPKRPLALLFVSFHLIAPVVYWLYRLRSGVRFDLVQMVESNLSFGGVSYSQFCHRTYLKRFWRQSGAKGLRGGLRWLDHRLHALAEPFVYRRVRRIVVASQGLARELRQEYPFTAEKILVIPNPVDLARMQPPSGFDRAGVRRELGVHDDGLALVFVALGQYERKGLPLLLEALNQTRDERLKLVVVGGEQDLVALYRSRVARMGLGGQVVFTGMQRDVRPYLWSADAFALPSFYEVFPLVSLEAAAAGLPVMSTPLNGVEEFLRDGRNGILLERSAAGVAAGCERLLTLAAEERQAMGAESRRSVGVYSPENFAAAWRRLYESLEPRA